MDRSTKAELVGQLREELEGVPSLVVASGAGLNANAMNDLRAQLRAVGAKYRVVKNTLARRAVEGTALENISHEFVGSTALVYHPEEAVPAAKVLVDFAKKNEKLVLRAGWLNGDLLDEAGVDALSKMPGKDELRQKLLAVMVAVPTSVVRVLAAGPTSFLNVLNARRDSIQ